MPSIPVFCGKDCGGNACPLLADIEDGRVTRVRNNPAGGKNLKGCRRGFNLPLEQYASDRVLTPLIRSGPRGSGQFREASWEEALSLVADMLGEIRAKHGASAVLNRSSAGVTGALHCTYTLLNRFLNLYGGCTRTSGNYSCGAAMFALPYVLGEDCWAAGFDAATMKYAEMIVLWGANVLETRQGGEIPQRLMEAKRRGTRIVVIDPRRSATVKQAATRWIACRPGTDTALMLAVLQVLFAEGLADREFIRAHAAGFERLEAYVMGQDGGEARTPRWAAGVCRVPAEEITRFAREYAAAKPAMLLPGYSIQRSFAGEETYRLAVALQVATGNFGVRGGSTGAINSFLPIPRAGSLEAPVLKDQPELPVLRWPDAVLEGRGGGYPSDIHAIYTLGANAINQGGDVHKSIRAFEKVDFSVCHEQFMSPTARYSDVVLPAAGPLEKEDIGFPWLGNYLLYKPQALPARGQARSDYDILCDLSERLGFGEEFSEGRSAHEWVERFIEQSEVPDAEEFRRTGVYLAPEQERVGLEEFSRDPQAHPLRTPSGKVEIASERYQADTGLPAVPTWQEEQGDPRFPLRLITPKSALRTHSQGSNIPEIREREGHALALHPADAAARGIRDGELVRLFNEQGVTIIAAHLTEDIAPGVVCLPEGIWVTLSEKGEDTAGSANLLTSTRGTKASASAIMHAVRVEVAKQENWAGSW